MALAICLTAVGLFGAIYHPVGGAMLAAHATKLGSTLGINGVFGNVGVAIAALCTGALVTLAGWRIAFAVPGVLSILIGFLFLAKVSRAADRPAAAKKPGPPLPRSLMVRAFIVMAIVMTAGSMIFNATTVALPKLFDERVSLFAETPMGVGVIVCGVYLCGAVAQVIIGHWLDRHTLKTAFLPIAALLAPCLALSIVATDWAMIAVGMLLMFAVFGQVTINDAMVARYSSDAWRARAYAVRYFLSFGIAAAVVPMLSLLHNRTGDFSASFTILAVAGCIVLFGALIFPTRPDELAPAKPAVSPALKEARA
jgi:MFS family permease